MAAVGAGAERGEAAPLPWSRMLVPAFASLGIGVSLLGTGAQVAFAALAILVVGLPHGAGDHLVVMQHAPGRTGRLVVFLAVYLASVGGTLALWAAWPALSLALFLLLASLHFAVDDLPGEPLSRRPLERAVRGLAPATLPALLHTRDLAALHGLLSDPSWGAEVARVSAIMAPVVLAGGIWSVGRRLAERDRAAAGGLAATLAGLLLLPPLVGFALYFALVHSRGQTRRRMADLGFARLPDYLWAAAAPLAGAGAVFAMLGLAAVLGHAPPLVPLFVGLAALAVPHMLVTPLFAPDGPCEALRDQPAPVRVAA